MEIPFVDLKRQYQSIAPDIDAAIKAVVDSQYFIFGPISTRFEQAFARYLGSNFVVGVDNGTDGLMLALRALDIGQGDEVITQGNIHVATVVAIKEAGARAVLVDIDPDTQQIDVTKVEEKITPNTKALMPVHLFGAPCQIDEFVALAKKHNLRLIEDACQAHGAEFHGKKVGTFGDIGVFSFYPGKNLGAYGNGGGICTNDAATYERLRQLRNFGEEKKYFHPANGVNSRIDEIQAAVLEVKLEHLDQWNARRNVIAAAYKNALSGFKTPRILEGAVSNYHLFVLEVDRRDELLAYLVAHGVRAQIHYPIPVHLQPGYQYLGYKDGDFPITESLAKRIISLPVYAELTDEEVVYVCQAIKEFYG